MGKFFSCRRNLNGFERKIWILKNKLLKVFSTSECNTLGFCEWKLQSVVNLKRKINSLELVFFKFIFASFIIEIYCRPNLKLMCPLFTNVKPSKCPKFKEMLLL